MRFGTAARAAAAGRRRRLPSTRHRTPSSAPGRSCVPRELNACQSGMSLGADSLFVLDRAGAAHPEACDPVERDEDPVRNGTTVSPVVLQPASTWRDPGAGQTQQVVCSPERSLPCLRLRLAHGRVRLAPVHAHVERHADAQAQHRAAALRRARVVHPLRHQLPAAAPSAARRSKRPRGTTHRTRLQVVHRRAREDRPRRGLHLLRPVRAWLRLRAVRVRVGVPRAVRADEEDDRAEALVAQVQAGAHIALEARAVQERQVHVYVREVRVGEPPECRGLREVSVGWKLRLEQRHDGVVLHDRDRRRAFSTTFRMNRGV